MATYSGAAVIRQGDSEVAIACYLESWNDEIEVRPGERVPGLGQWEGTFDSPNPPFALESGNGVIELPDGQTGDLIVSLTIRDDGEHGKLTGSGKPPF